MFCVSLHTFRHLKKLSLGNIFGIDRTPSSLCTSIAIPKCCRIMEWNKAGHGGENVGQEEKHSVHIKRGPRRWWWWAGKLWKMQN